MTATVNIDYNQIVFQDDTLIRTRVDTMGINYSKNCADPIQSVDLSSEITNITSDHTLTLDVGDIIPGATIFPDGVYKFNLIFALIEDEDEEDPAPGTYTISACIYIGTTTRCKAAEKWVETKNDLLELTIKALSHTNECEDCDCEAMCEMYDYLLTLLEQTSTSDVSDGCGCP